MQIQESILNKAKMEIKCIYVVLLGWVLMQMIVKNGAQETDVGKITVLRDSAAELEEEFIIAYIAMPLCLIETCICLPIGIGLLIAVCATVPGCKLHKSLTKKVKEEYIIEAESAMGPPTMAVVTTIYPGSMMGAEPPQYDMRDMNY